MTAYRYVAFPPKAAPTAEELSAFHGYADLLDRRVAYGKRRGDGGLAIACEAEPFDRLRGLDPVFDELLLKWQVRGGEVVDSLPFVKDSRPWKTIATHPKEPQPAPKPPADPPAVATRERSPEQSLRDGNEAFGLGRLEAAKTIARGEAYQRWGERLPYVLWALAGTATLLVGAYLGDRLLAGDGERRSDTVERVLQDPLGERLDSGRRATTPPRRGDSDS